MGCVCVCRLRESGSALPQQPAPCGAAAGTTSPHNSPTRSCPHARRHLVGHAYSPTSSFWSGPSALAPCVGHSPRVRTPWSHVFLITSMVYRCVLSCPVSLILSALVFLVSCWCGLVLSARVYPVWSSLVFPMPWCRGRLALLVCWWSVPAAVPLDRWEPDDTVPVSLVTPT